MKPKVNKKAIFIGVGLGVSYGILAQFAIRIEALNDFFGIMSLGFVFVLPFCLGAITIYFAEPPLKRLWGYRIFFPWVTAMICLFFALITGLEGTICLLMAIPIYFPLASLGGVFMGLVDSNFNSNKLNSSILGLLLFTPFVMSGIEERIELPILTKQVDTSILINASPKIVWSQITRIPKITEDQNSIFYLMGFPRPVEATLSFEGVGGIREAKFEKGLMFLETITHWVPEQKLTFKIQAEPKNTPLTTLDSHVVVGGRYFDTLLGEYKIETLGKNKVILHLFSRYRLSTRFNFYAELWSDFLMRDIQNNILNVIRSRSEREAQKTNP